MITTTTTICPAQPCDQSIETDCIIYDNDHDCIGITSGMTVTEVVDIILDKLNLIDCTTTVPPTCGCYLLINNDGATKTYQYTPCGGVLSNAINLLSNQRIYICSSTIPSVDLGIKIGTAFTLNCDPTELNCVNPTSYCHTISVIGTVSFQYINYLGTLITSLSITNASVTICAWQNSIDKISGTGTYTITEPLITCPLGTC